MKKNVSRFILILLGLAVSFPTYANNNIITSKQPSATTAKDTSAAINALKAMSKSIKESNYQLFFNVYNSAGLDEYKFTNIYTDKQRYAELKNLEGPLYQVFLKNNYIGNSNYALEGDHFDILPNIFYVDFGTLGQNYMMVKSGTARIADRPADIYDISNKFANLYSYQIAVDQETKLPTKVLLVNRDLVSNSYTIISSFTVLNLEFGSSILEQKGNELINANINTKTVINSNIDSNINEQINNIMNLPFLPAGFKLISNNSVSMLGENLIAPSTGNTDKTTTMLAQTYSDGLFSFTLYVSKEVVSTNDHYHWQQGDTTMYAEDYAGHKIILVGQIPLSLAKGIVNSINIYESNGSLSTKAHPNGYGQQLNTGNYE